jgi:hypothetical protein
MLEQYESIEGIIERMRHRLIVGFSRQPTHLFVSPEVHTVLCSAKAIGGVLRVDDWDGMTVVIVPTLEGADEVYPTLLMAPTPGCANTREKVMDARTFWLDRGFSPNKIFVGPIVHTQLCQLCKVETLVGNGFCGLRVHLVPSITDDLFYLR